MQAFLCRQTEAQTYNIKNNSRKPPAKAPHKKLLWGAFGYCLLTDAWQGATATVSVGN